MQLFLYLVTGLLLCSMTTGASANLIINGGFETEIVKPGGWNWFPSNQVSGWQGSNIEIWRSLGGVHAFEGKQHAELNAHPFNARVYSIYQSFDTQPGESYQVKFAYRARTGKGERFKAELSTDSNVLWSAIFDDHIKRQWTQFCSTFNALSEKTVLRFTSLQPSSGTSGNLLDAVAVTKTQEIPETISRNDVERIPLTVPGTLSLCLACIVWWIVSGATIARRQQRSGSFTTT